MWLKMVMLLCALLLLVVPFTWNSRLVWYQIPYGIWFVDILAVVLLFYPHMLWTQVTHFSIPVVWHPTITCPHFLCLSQWCPWLYVGCAFRNCASFPHICCPSWIWSCIFSWVIYLSTMKILVHLRFGRPIVIAADNPILEKSMGSLHTMKIWEFYLEPS